MKDNEQEKDKSYSLKHEGLPEWVVAYNANNYRSSAGQAVRILFEEVECLKTIIADQAKEIEELKTSIKELYKIAQQKLYEIQVNDPKFNDIRKALDNAQNCLKLTSTDKR